MTQVNMYEAKTELSKLVRLLETKQEDVIYLARGGVRVAQITRIPENEVSKRIGAAVGSISLPVRFDEAFDSLDGDVSALFDGEASE
ncbi:MAG: toxin-antitoxin system, antitoxin component, PHD family protein [Clostridia bacterium]|nr:toxin-antitoxin system, antitoxin component, PHD family protein [Clostridia bacterium]